MDEAQEAQANIRTANANDVEAITDILAEAFAEDPVMMWMFGNAGPIRTLFKELASGVYLSDGFGHIAEDRAATLWLPSDAKVKLPLFNELKLAFGVLSSAGASALVRARNLSAITLAAHPREPHFYLFAVGVRNAHKGKGIGGRIIREGLRRADDAGAPAYLENSNPRNTPLYERLGFEATAPLDLPSDAPPLLGMKRPAPLNSAR